MVTDAFCAYAIAQVVVAQAFWAQLHTGDPGPNGLFAGSVDQTRQQILWGTIDGCRAYSSNTLRWDEVSGVPGFPQNISHLSLWSGPQGGLCWATTRLVPLRVPHKATLEIPPGITLDLSPVT